VIQLIAKDAGLRLNLSINAAAEVVTSYASIFELPIEQRRLRVREVRPASRGNTLGALPSNILSTLRPSATIIYRYRENIGLSPDHSAPGSIPVGMVLLRQLAPRLLTRPAFLLHSHSGYRSRSRYHRNV
jgi:hypothetical protein